MSEYKIIDFIFGEEKETSGTGYGFKPKYKVFPIKLKKQIEQFCEKGGNVFISGAYIGTDLKTKEDVEFANKILKYKHRTNHADVTGDVYSVNNLFRMNALKYNTKYNPEIYTVEAPDAVEPFGDKAKTIFRYGSNNTSAAVAYKNKYAVIVLGFPFETILSEKSKNDLIQLILNFFEEG